MNPAVDDVFFVLYSVTCLTSTFSDINFTIILSPSTSGEVGTSYQMLEVVEKER